MLLSLPMDRALPDDKSQKKMFSLDLPVSGYQLVSTFEGGDTMIMNRLCSVRNSSTDIASSTSSSARREVIVTTGNIR